MAKKITSLPTWVQLYFVAASLLGLVMLAGGSAMGINTLLSQYVLTPVRRPTPPPRPTLLERPAVDTETLTEDQQALLVEWEEEYEAWQNAESEIDYEAESRKRTLTSALAMILVGAPIFAFHVPFVFRQTQK